MLFGKRMTPMIRASGHWPYTAQRTPHQATGRTLHNGHLTRRGGRCAELLSVTLANYGMLHHDCCAKGFKNAYLVIGVPHEK